MPYFQASEERPRRSKRFLTAREVEDLAAAGATEIALLEDMVITDAARETAADLALPIRAPKSPDISATQPVRVGRAPGEVTTTTPNPAAPALATADAVSQLQGSQSTAAQHARSNDPLVLALVQAARSSLRPSLR